MGDRGESLSVGTKEVGTSTGVGAGVTMSGVGDVLFLAVGAGNTAWKVHPQTPVCTIAHTESCGATQELLLFV